LRRVWLFHRFGGWAAQLFAVLFATLIAEIIAVAPIAASATASTPARTALAVTVFLSRILLLRGLGWLWRKSGRRRFNSCDVFVVFRVGDNVFRGRLMGELRALTTLAAASAAAPAAPVSVAALALAIVLHGLRRFG
jgi:hypothetical protein